MVSNQYAGLPLKLIVYSSNYALFHKVAMWSPDRIWLDGRRYMTVGNALDDFMPNGLTQLDLFDDIRPWIKCVQLMKVLDGINQSGLCNIWFVVQKQIRCWRRIWRCLGLPGWRVQAISPCKRGVLLTVMKKIILWAKSIFFKSLRDSLSASLLLSEEKH